MQIIKKQLVLTTSDYYLTHLNLINTLLPVKLTQKEIEVLAIFMSFTGDLEKIRFGTTGKQIVREKLELSHPGLSNYLKSLTKKGFIKKVGQETIILPILFPEKNQQLYQIRFIHKK